MSAITQIEEHRRRQWTYDEQKPVPGGGIVYVTADYDDAFSVGLLYEITELYNNGMKLEDIADKFKRPAVEIFLALLYQADNEKITRPFAKRKKGAIS